MSTATSGYIMRRNVKLTEDIKVVHMMETVQIQGVEDFKWLMVH